MTDSPTNSPFTTHDLNHHQNQISGNKIHENNHLQIQIPVEIVSEEEMALIEAAFSLSTAARRPSLSLLCSTSFDSLSLVSKRGFSGGSVVCDVEDLGQLKRPMKKKNKISVSFLSRFRKKRGLSVTDLTSTEWCEKQMAFGLLYGRPEITNAMKAGITRHTQLEEEVTKKVEVCVETPEDIWALKFMNFIICANQLLFDGLTRELPVVGFVQGTWMVGVIDELRMPVTGNDRKLTLVDTKTRGQPRLPAEPQRRNGRLQLMCYKYLWDNLVSDNFPLKQFYDFFSLDAQHVLSDQIKMSAADSGLPAETLGEVVRYFSNVCSMLPPAHDQLLLRYELQKDNSLIGEDEFIYDDNWIKTQIRGCLQFWQGEREAKYVPDTERWKCRFCQFATVCHSESEANS